MDLGQYIKRTAVRRVVWIVVGLVVYGILAAFGVARAQQVPSYQDCYASIDRAPWCPNEGDALAAVMARAQEHVDAWNRPGRAVASTCAPETNSGHSPVYGEYFSVEVGVVREGLESCGVNYMARPARRYLAGNLCRNADSVQYNRNTSIWGAPPGEICQSGCGFSRDASSELCTLVEEGPTSGYWCNTIYNPSGSTCTAGEDLPPDDPDAPDATCSADEVRLPNGQCAPRGQCPLGQQEVDGACHPVGNCPSYHVKAPDGSCTPVPCPSGQARGQDGTCKADGNSDGTPDEEGPEGDSDNKDGMQFSGGESCSVPPTCSGDPIMCGQARIQWRIDCNTRRAESVPGGNACDNFNMPICVGEACDPVEQKQLILQWQSMCALQDLVSQDGEGEGDGGGDLGGIKDGIDRIGDFLDGGGNCLSTEEGCEPVEVPWDDEEPQRVSWSSGLSSTGTCPAPVSTTITLAGYSAPIEFSYQPICDFAALMRWVLITAATIVSGLIVAGVRSTGGGA